jgi:hypothetical protein
MESPHDGDGCIEVCAESLDETWVHFWQEEGEGEEKEGRELRMLGAGASFGPWSGGGNCSALEEACSGGSSGCAAGFCDSVSGEPCRTLFHMPWEHFCP